jgi:hypothetical protein
VAGLLAEEAERLRPVTSAAAAAAVFTPAMTVTLFEFLADNAVGTDETRDPTAPSCPDPMSV